MRNTHRYIIWTTPPRSRPAARPHGEQTAGHVTAAVCERQKRTHTNALPQWDTHTQRSFVTWGSFTEPSITESSCCCFFSLMSVTQRRTERRLRHLFSGESNWVSPWEGNLCLSARQPRNYRLSLQEKTVYPIWEVSLTRWLLDSIVSAGLPHRLTPARSNFPIGSQ